MNSGLPTTAVMTPAGNPYGNILTAVSAIKSIKAPVNAIVSSNHTNFVVGVFIFFMCYNARKIIEVCL